MQISLERSILEQLSWRGILAYAAVKMADCAVATTAFLASLVRCQTAVMLEGLKELAVVAPGAVEKAKRGAWNCGTVMMEGPSVVTPFVDSQRYREFVDDLKKYWEYLNPEIKFEMDGRDGTQIRKFLGARRSWERVQWCRALHNRVLSIVNYNHASRSEPIWKWVAHLEDYVGGPLDPFNKPAERSAKRGEAISIQQGNRQAGEAFLDRVRKSNGTEH